MPKFAGRRKLLEDNPWLTFLLPFIVFMVAGTIEPTPEVPGGEAIGLNIPYSYYPLLYSLKMVLVVAAVCFVLPGYRQFPLRVSPLAVVVGVVGVVVCVGICLLKIESRFLAPALEAIHFGGIIPSGERSSFNPLEEMSATPALAWGFLAVRFFGLAAVVPLIEEMFLRGFVMRYVVQGEWWKVPFGKVTPMAVALGTLLPMAMHPGELLAAAAWFSMVTWLMLRTKNIWDCVIAHAITNLLLGIYVVWSGHWELM